MTVQEAIKIQREWNKANVDEPSVGLFADNEMGEAIDILIRAAEENEGRKLAEKWYLQDCNGCPFSTPCVGKKPLCVHVSDNIDLWIEAAKKEM